MEKTAALKTVQSFNDLPLALNACLWKGIIDIPQMPYEWRHNLASDRAATTPIPNFHNVNKNSCFTLIQPSDLNLLYLLIKKVPESFSGPFSKSRYYASGDKLSLCYESESLNHFFFFKKH